MFSHLIPRSHWTRIRSVYFVLSNHAKVAIALRVWPCDITETVPVLASAPAKYHP